MRARPILALLTVLTLLFGQVAMPAMAEPASASTQSVTAMGGVVAGTADCHGSAAATETAKAPKTTPPKAADAKPCCPDGCDGQCTPAAAFFAGLARATLGFLRSVMETSALAAPPSLSVHGPERPPRLSA